MRRVTHFTRFGEYARLCRLADLLSASFDNYKFIYTNKSNHNGMFIQQNMYAVVNNEDNTERSFEFINDARRQLVNLVESGINAQLLRVNTVRGRHC